ncbi:MAG TPA: 50S ribosomal protein L32 [Candidatus Angelobacter sp.]|nr:50S ribosomal protein L32 [Candidatus Angelobacter sp.]
MAHPKKRHSKSRKRKRRNHQKSKATQLTIDPITKKFHPYHKAYCFENKLYYIGKVLFVKN